MSNFYHPSGTGDIAVLGMTLILNEAANELVLVIVQYRPKQKQNYIHCIGTIAYIILPKITFLNLFWNLRIHYLIQSRYQLSDCIYA